jgi:hypothetical protein
MSKKILGLILLLVFVASTKFSLKLKSYEKQCFFEILSNNEATQRPSRSIRLTSVPSHRASMSCKSATCSREGGILSSTDRRRLTSKLSTSTNLPLLTPHILSASATSTTKIWRSVPTFSPASSSWSSNCCPTSQTPKTLSASWAGWRTKNQNFSKAWTALKVYVLLQKTWQIWCQQKW